MSALFPQTLGSSPFGSLVIVPKAWSSAPRCPVCKAAELLCDPFCAGPRCDEEGEDRSDERAADERRPADRADEE